MEAYMKVRAAAQVTPTSNHLTLILLSQFLSIYNRITLSNYYLGLCFNVQNSMYLSRIFYTMV